MRLLFVPASPGKQITLPQSLMTTTTTTGVNSSTIVTGATSSITNEMNKNPNTILHAMSSPSSAASVSTPKNTEKVYAYLCIFAFLLYREEGNNFDQFMNLRMSILFRNMEELYSQIVR